MVTDYRTPGDREHSSVYEDPARLSDPEVLARILDPKGPPGVLRKAKRLLAGGTLADFAVRPEHRSLTLLQAHRLRAALELAERLAQGRYPLGRQVNGPKDVYALSTDLIPASKEHFVAHYLNTRNALLARETISIGSLNASIVHPREVFEPAVRRKACAVIVVHNHPSGNPDPSEDDIRITRRLREAGEILGIPLLDHVIVAANGFRSLEEEGYLRS